MSRPICRYFLNGGCRYGSRCRFIHPTPVKKEVPPEQRCRDCQGHRSNSDPKQPCYECREKCFSCGSQQKYPETYCGQCQEEGPRCIRCKKADRLPQDYYCETCQKVSCQYCGCYSDSAKIETTCSDCSKTHVCPIEGCNNELIGDAHLKCSECKKLHILYKRIGLSEDPNQRSNEFPLNEKSEKFIVSVLYRAKDALHRGYCSDPTETVTIHSEFIKEFPLHKKFDSLVEELMQNEDNITNEECNNEYYSNDDPFYKMFIDEDCGEVEVREEWMTPLEQSCKVMAAKRWVNFKRSDTHISVDGLPMQRPIGQIPLAGVKLPSSHSYFYDLGRYGCSRGSNYCGMGISYQVIKFVAVPINQ